jgi:hypothetical protein
MITISTNEFRRLIGHIQEYLDNPNLPNTMAKIAIDTLKMYDVEAYEENKKYESRT